MTSLALARVVEAVDEVRATRSRTAKIATLAELLREAGSQDAEALLGVLLGVIRQGRIGVGHRSLATVQQEVPPASASSLTIAAVDAAFDEVATAGDSGTGSTAARREALSRLFALATPDERQLLTGALLGDVRTGALAGVLTDALAKALEKPLAQVRRAVMLSGSLPQTAAAALGDPESLSRVSLSVGVPVQPMLAATAANVQDALQGVGLASVEHKLDGARIQVHRNGSDVSVYTRSLADITPRVPEIVELVRTFAGEKFILDGETLALDEDGGPRPFQDTMSRFGAQAERSQILAPRFFDILHLDGRDLIDEPLTARQDALAGLVGDYRIEGELTDDPDVAARILSEALELGHEGVMVKAADSPYAAGRRGKSWLKIKPVHTLDLVVLAAEWGFGRRTGWLSNLHLGARDPEDGSFVMVGKTFKGLTDALLTWQTETFPSYAVRESPGVVWLRPELVVEIAIDGVQRSSRYPGGVALRFARVKGYRPDKTPADADSLATLQAMLR